MKTNEKANLIQILRTVLSPSKNQTARDCWAATLHTECDELHELFVIPQFPTLR